MQRLIAPLLLGLLLAPSIVGASADCTVVFRLQDQVTLGNIGWLTDYGDAPGFFAGAGPGVECERLDKDTLMAPMDEDGSSILTLGVISLTGIVGPTDLVKCRFEAFDTPVPSDFDITVREAGNTGGVEIVPPPTVAIGSITCSGSCGDGELDAGETCDDGNTIGGDGCSPDCEQTPLCGDATGDGKVLASDALRILQRAVGIAVECPRWLCDVDGLNGIGAGDALRILRRSVDNPVTLACGQPTLIVVKLLSAAKLGALQIDLSYEELDGDIKGSGSTVSCRLLQNAALVEFNDTPQRHLEASFISLAGLVGPGLLAECDFESGGSADPHDLHLSIVDAKDVDGNDIDEPAVKALLD